MLGKGLPVDYDDPAVAALYDPVALELAHHLGDGLPSGGDHVREILVRQAHVDARASTVALTEAFAQVHQQRREPGRDLPVQQALYNLIGLPEPLGERGEELEGEAGIALDHPLYRSLLDARDPRVGDGLGEDVLPAPLDEVELAEDGALLEERGRGLLIVAVDLVQAHRAREQKVELIVRVARGKDHVPRTEAPLYGPQSGLLEVLETEPLRCAGGSEPSRAVARKHLTRPL